MTSRRTLQQLFFFGWNPFRFQHETHHVTPSAEAALRRILDEIFRTDQENARILDDDDYLSAVSRLSRDEWQDIRRQLIDGRRPLLVRDEEGYLSYPPLTEEIRHSQPSRQPTGQTENAERRLGRQPPHPSPSDR